jgi:hypothetical protein
MDQQELITKLDQIEEQARLTVEEFPKHLAKERQRMIIALVRYIRTEALIASTVAPFASSERSDETHPQ